MATRNFVPRKDGEGSIGKGRKQWNVVYADHINTLGRNRSYTVGDIAYSRHLPSWVRLECVKAGTTAGSMPNLAAVSQCGVMITDGSVVWIVDDLRDGTPIGAVRASVYVPAGYIKANGATVQRADYPRLLAYIERNTLWTSYPNTYPGLFGFGDRSTTFILPNWVDRMVQYTADGIGDAIAAGLPNIVGRITSSSGYGLWWGAANDGAKEIYNPSISALQLSNEDFNGKAKGGPNPMGLGAPATDGAQQNNTIRLDAARSNPIYGRSSTVQPAAIKLIPIIRY